MMYASVYPEGSAEGRAIQEGMSYNKEALRLMRLGDYSGAEAQHLRAIQDQERGLPKNSNHLSIGISYNGLGEVYILMNHLDDAEHYLLLAIRVRQNGGPAMDLAMSRDNLGKVYEMRGNLMKAKELRLEGSPDDMICSNFTCTTGIKLPLNQLSHCGKCKSIFYCSPKCQKADWKRHKKYCQTQ
ncbi:hypothetical protein C8Q75DRAFT_854374 [Abortiporus biennis]|nr:hypothetical protein C8Q75DRAFT_854374 [Abortiporus biennis]